MSGQNDQCLFSKASLCLLCSSSLVCHIFSLNMIYLILPTYLCAIGCKPTKSICFCHLQGLLYTTWLAKLNHSGISYQYCTHIQHLVHRKVNCEETSSLLFLKYIEFKCICSNIGLWITTIFKCHCSWTNLCLRIIVGSILHNIVCFHSIRSMEISG
jgi:hypothetical protein